MMQLWSSGALTYDILRKQDFVMRVALMWTINDFPAYGMVFGWSTHVFSFFETLCKLEMIFPLLFFDLMEHLRIHLPFEAKVPSKASVCEAYIVEEVSTFISYYFKSHLRMRINSVSQHDDGGEVPSNRNLSIFSNPGRPAPKNVVRGRYLSEIEFRQAHNYVLFNCDELGPFIQ